MRNGFGRIAFVSCGIGLLLAGGTSEAGGPDKGGLISLKVVRVNPECSSESTNAGEFCTNDNECGLGVCDGAITPTNDLVAAEGDVLVAEFLLSDWSPNNISPDEKLKAYQAGIDIEGFFSGSCGEVVPKGWCRRIDAPTCRTDADCLEEEFCLIIEDIILACGCPGFDPQAGAFIDKFHPSFVFPNASVFAPIDLRNYRYAVALIDLQAAPLYDGTPKYGATLILEVRPGARGTFSIPMVGEDSQMITRDGNIFQPDVEGLTITIPGACPCTGVVLASDPPNCALDARQPSAPNGTAEAGWDRITLTFDGDDCSNIDCGDFSIAEFPSPRFGQAAVDHCEFNESDVTVVINQRISLQTWTCVRMGLELVSCVGHLPGDTNSDVTASPPDILSVIDNLNGVVDPPMEMWQCDVDRSNSCGPPDILRVIDLLNGAGAYDPWLNVSIEDDADLLIPCPTAAP